jgi:predicted dehydrogenase
MKALLAGIGSFGRYWYQSIKEKTPDLKIAVADPDPGKSSLLTGPDDTYYTSFRKALEVENPDFVINATPPGVHTAINQLAFDHHLPVLCEKPIASDYLQAVEIVSRAARERIPFMVAANYRREPAMRTARRLIENGEIGEIDTIQIQFFRNYRADKPYLMRMADPLLVDVAVHHMDCIRYLTGSEGKTIFARSYNPKGSIFQGNAGLNFCLEMEDGVQVNFSGNMSCRGIETTWLGNWRIEGKSGVLLIDPGIQLLKSGEISEISAPGKVESGDILIEFLNSLYGKKPMETNAADYLKTQALVYYAEQSSRSQCTLEIEIPPA